MKFLSFAWHVYLFSGKWDYKNEDLHGKCPRQFCDLCENFVIESDGAYVFFVRQIVPFPPFSMENLCGLKSFLSKSKVIYGPCIIADGTEELLQ